MTEGVVIPLLTGRDRWERVVDGWCDNSHADAFTHTVRLVEGTPGADPDRGVEIVVVATPSPGYEIREARATAVGDAVDPAVLAGCAKLGGVAMVAGLGRRLAEATGEGAGASLVRDAVVEIARLARQVAKLPRDVADRAVAAGAAACRETDQAGFADLPDSCFTYSDASRALFTSREVSTPMTAELYSPRPGAPRVFVRRKVARLERLDGRVRLTHSMHDNVHGFDVVYEIDTATGRFVRAEHTTSRLPYAGVCTEPQRRMAGMLGETLDAGLAKRVQSHLGGRLGCAQLYDLTADLLKLVAAPV
ncbi:MAG: DUF2889 domain-containing protein [Candidatus Rokubacteria bacterium]|nr:DUF2889 domain-containing protein [Candidatus Rokubacteria bacterium]